MRELHHHFKEISLIIRHAMIEDVSSIVASKLEKFDKILSKSSFSKFVETQSRDDERREMRFENDTQLERTRRFNSTNFNDSSLKRASSIDREMRNHFDKNRQVKHHINYDDDFVDDNRVNDNHNSLLNNSDNSMIDRFIEISRLLENLQQLKRDVVDLE